LSVAVAVIVCSPGDASSGETVQLARPEVVSLDVHPTAALAGSVDAS
jgi:hypothetical protein